MPQISITQLPQAQALSGTESVPIVQNGVTVQTTTSAISGAGALNYPFLTVGSTAGLTQARYMAAGTGLSLTDNGAGSTLQVNLTGAALSLDSSGTGIQVKTGPNTLTPRQIAVGGGMTVSNADGVSGNPTIGLDTNLQNLSALSGTGLVTVNGSSFSQTSILGTTSQIDVANGNASGGNPTVGIASNPTLPGTGSMVLPQGTTAQRSAAAYGALRYNTESQSLEAYTQLTGWGTIVSGGGVNSFSAGSTGLTPNSPTTGAIVLAGILNPASGGTGVNNGSYAITLGGSLTTAESFTTSGAHAITLTATNTTSLTLPTTGTLATLAGAETLTNKTISGSNNSLSNIANASLSNSSVTYNGVTVALGASGTITAATPNALTSGTGLQFDSGTTFDGSVAKTISIDSTVATLNGSQTFTNKSMSGASNTFTNIPNSGLTNSSITINGSSVSLGGSVTVTATATNALTIGTGLSGTSYNGSTPVTIAIDSTVATLTGSQTLTNKSISGTSNTLTNIPNSALTNSSVTIGTTAISLGSSSLTLSGLTTVTVTQDPTAAYELTTKQYVDGLVATGLYYHQPVQVATTQDLATQTGGTVTYNNGSAGVGATITLSVALNTLDGYSLSNTNRILVKDEVNQAYNGVYTWATGGTVLTRSTDTDSYGSGTGDLSQNDYFFVQNGTVNKGVSFVCTTVGTIVFGTTAITFAEFSTSQVYTGTSPINVSGTVISLSTVPVSSGGTGITSGTSGGVPYFSSSSTIASSAVLAANALVIGGGAGVAPSTTTTGTGVITALGTNVGTAGAFVVNGGALGTPSSGTLTNVTGLPISTGVSGLGTGVATALAVNTGTAGAFVVNGGALGTPSSGTLTNATGLPISTGVSGLGTGVASALVVNTGSAGAFVVNGGALGTPSSGTLTSCTGLPLSTGVTGTLGVSNGGTGQSSYTTGDIIYASATTTLSKLSIGTSTYILTSSGTAPQWTDPTSISVGTATNATNATNTAITANSTNATNYLTFVSTTTGNLPQLVNSSITCNPSTGQITGGVSGGAF